MGIWDTISSWWEENQVNWTLERVTPPALPEEVGRLPYGQAISPNGAYVRITMRSMAIRSTRSGWSRFHAVLYSQTSLPLRNGVKAELQAVLSPDFFKNLDSTRLQNVLSIDQVIFGPVPFAGGSLTTRLGVFAVKHADLSQPFISVLTTLASASGVAFVGAATPFIGPIKNAIELLTGTAGATSLEIGLDRQHTPPITGWFALVKAPAGTLPEAELSVRESNLELLRNGHSMPGTPYLLFSVEALNRRDDFAQIKELGDAYGEFRRAASVNHQNDAREAVAKFARLARISPELLPAHAEDVITAVEKEEQRVFKGGGVSSLSAEAGEVAEFSNLTVQFRDLASGTST